MSQTFRSRDEQVADLTSQFGEEGTFSFADDRDAATKHIQEAEARGAEEQRRKDGEGCERWEFEEPEYHDQGMGCGLEDRGIHDRYQAMEYGWDQAVERCIERIPEELYTRPADVSALEARVKELEAENARLKTAQFYGHDGEEGGSEDMSTFFDDHEPGTILEIDGYRRVNTKWVLWDGHFPHVFDTEDEARAALTRVGGV